MNCLVAPDKFKGSLSAQEVCEAIEQGLRRYDPNMDITKIPLADGGEGTLEILDDYLDLETVTLEVSDPLFRPVRASYKRSGTTAYVEMAQASGLDLLNAQERNCLNTSSLGTGEIIWDAIENGARQIYLFIGGSATSEAGLGVLQALGIKAINKGQVLPPVGSSLVDITELDTSDLKIEPQELEFIVVCDVRNPLYGPQGAAFVYAPQKGADQQAVHLLDKGLRNFADIIKQQTGMNINDFEGSGAAGGIAAGIKAFFPARIQRGIDTIMELVDLRTALNRADLVITGEGKLDGQTLEGKVIAGVHGLCKIAGKKLAVICGSSTLTPEQTKDMGFWEVQPLVKDDIPMQVALDNAFKLVSKRAFELLSARSLNDQ